MHFEKGFKFETDHLAKNDQIKSFLECQSKFEILNILGKGGFGLVCHVKHLRTDEK